MNCFRRFILGMAKVDGSWNNLKTKNVRFNCTPACEKAFEHLCEPLTYDPVLKLSDPDLQVRV